MTAILFLPLFQCAASGAGQSFLGPYKRVVFDPSHFDEYFGLGVSCLDIADCFSEPFQWVFSVNCRHNLAGLKEPPKKWISSRFGFSSEAERILLPAALENIGARMDCTSMRPIEVNPTMTHVPVGFNVRIKSPTERFPTLSSTRS